MKHWLVIGSDGVMKIIGQEETASDAAYSAADRYGMSAVQMTVYQLGEPVSYNRGWVKEYEPSSS